MVNPSNCRRSRRAPRTNTVRKNFVTPAQLRSRERGSYNRGRFDPPPIVAQPWNNCVIASLSTIQEPGLYDLTVSSVATALRGQLGLPVDLDMNLRIRRISMWTTQYDVVASSVNFGLQPHDLVSTHRLQWLEDFGTATRPAHLHFTWPVTSQEYSLRTSTDFSRVIASLDHLGTFSYIVHVQVLWKPYAADPIPTLRRRSIVFEPTALSAFEHLSLSSDTA